MLGISYMILCGSDYYYHEHQGVRIWNFEGKKKTETKQNK